MRVLRSARSCTYTYSLHHRSTCSAAAAEAQLCRDSGYDEPAACVSNLFGPSIPEPAERWRPGTAAEASARLMTVRHALKARRAHSRTKTRQALKTSLKSLRLNARVAAHFYRSTVSRTADISCLYFLIYLLIIQLLTL